MTKKIIYIILITFILVSIINTGVVNAFTDVLDNPASYEPGTGTSDKAEKVISRILSTTSVIGIAISVVMLAVLGLKYMMGSVEEKAEYKQSLVPYVVGAAMLFGITTITKIIVDFGETISKFGA